MSQATFDPTAHGGSSDDSGEARPAKTPHRRPARRGRGTSAKATEAAAQQATTPAQPAAVAPAEAAAVSEPAPATTEEPAAHGEGHGRRSRSGAKRPATRGKTGAQLIIAKAAEEAQPASEATEATPAPVAEATITAAAEATETPAPAAPLKTRFGQPRRPRPGTPTEVVAPVTEAPTEAATPAPAEAATTEAAEQPVAAESARRYRFDRSRATIPGAATRPERLTGPRGALYTGAEEQPAAPEAVTPETPARKSIFELPEIEALISGATELPALTFETPAAVTEEAEQLEETTEATEAGEAGEGVSSAARRRRRRRRPSGHNGAHGAELDETAEEEESAFPEIEPLEVPALESERELAAELDELLQQETPRETHETRGARIEPGIPTRTRSGRFGYPSRVARRAPAEPAWEAPQPAAAEASPYGSPEPAAARGFGATPAGVAMPARETYTRPARVERGDTSGAQVAQLGAVIREAINTQTDRLLSELRRQQPPAVTLAIPNTQTAERVGVFVDVANVIYSARNLRTTVDFGHLLDFLRANRRLARAQAYAPTDPMPGAEQQFLSAVRGLGYRITTKNYKTFANGAKKADLDLDLCMDIVRIVDAKAVDTIVLVSGDSDFLPLLDYCSDHGVRVEVAAFDDAASMILRQSCDLFVNLSLVEGIHG